MGFSQSQKEAINKFRAENGTGVSKKEGKLIPKRPHLSPAEQARLARRGRELEACLNKK